MGEKALVEGQILDAIALVKRLDANNASPTLAAWHFDSAIDVWSLLIAGPAFDPLLPRSSAYGIIVEALSDMDPSSMSVADVKLVHSQSKLPKTIGMLIRTPSNALGRSHFTDNFINGVFLKEMFVLRSASADMAPAA